MNQNQKTYESYGGGASSEEMIEFARRLYAEEPEQALEKLFERPFPTWEQLTDEARVLYLQRAEQAFRIIIGMMAEQEQTCRVCGCTDDNACPGGCSWAEPGLCSACVDKDDTGPADDFEPGKGEFPRAEEAARKLNLELKIDHSQFDAWTKHAVETLRKLGIACEAVGVTLDVASPAPRYFIGADESGHSYIVPVDQAEAWHQWRALPESDPTAWETPAFARRIVEGGLTFTDPQWF